MLSVYLFIILVMDMFRSVVLGVGFLQLFIVVVAFVFVSQIKYLQQKLESAVKETENVKKSSDRSKALDALRDENTALKVHFCKYNTLLLWSS